VPSVCLVVVNLLRNLLYPPSHPTTEFSLASCLVEHVTAASDIVLAEGTGHCGVGSIVGLNNAKIASLIGADMVLVCNGGLGSAFDELELNRILCQHYNVRVAGVIINKVIPDKLEQTEHYMRKAMKQAWGVPLLGCIPDRPFLGCPALADLEHLFHTKLLCGAEHVFRHYAIGDINVVTTSMRRFLENLRNKPPRTLYICHVTRDDLIVGFMSEYVLFNAFFAPCCLCDVVTLSLTVYLFLIQVSATARTG